MKGSNGSGNTKKHGKSREKAEKGRATAGSNIAVLVQKIEALEKKIFESQRSEEALRANQAILHATIENLPFDFFAIGENGF